MTQPPKQPDTAVDPVDEAMRLHMISIRIEKELIESFKLLAEYKRMNYHLLMRDALNAYVNAEMKDILYGIVAKRKIK